MYDDEFYDRRPARNPMATASVILGVLALMSCSIFYISLPFGALAIICAILSRNHRMLKRSIAGIICGALGIILSACITVYAVYYVLGTESGRSWLQYYLQMYSGDYSLDDILNDLYDTDSDSGENEDNGSGDSLPDEKYGNGDSLPNGNYGSGDELPNGNYGNGDSLPDGNDNSNGSGSGNFINYTPAGSDIFPAVLPQAAFL